MRKLKNEELNRLSPEEFESTEKNPIVLVLDNVRSMHNVGSAFRTGDAFAVEEIVLCGITATPPHREIHKTALGATDTVKWKHEKDTVAACKALQAEGYRLLAVEQADNSTSLETFSPQADEKLALVFGNEVFGVADEVITMADGCLEIPQYGTKHSLNISVSIGVVVWDVVSKMGNS
ncbi:SpoU rRNA methylase family protein [Roseivirga pacifica]|uniref:SpoU rRNA Methylase family protein n=1 Tax=Roseivirga pacifica TaxID=1267423 RepID=A0A1I0MDA9_9BACT|nr:RNA methyltransferase [Roseivirga pacifica]RKQ50311.1 SpoU rRNA methylase family protein [Roseivirga pacifica]SEV86447.1 SpoU rRNA Methylase family protein [Roseivirga pacifica]